MTERESTEAMARAERDALEGRAVLVTGGLGFIGSALAARLAKAGATVHTSSRRPAPDHGVGRHWRVDLSDAPAVASLVRELKPDYVFHLASHVMGAPDLEHVLPTFRGNLQSTVNLLCSLAGTGCRRMLTTGSLVEPEAGLRSIPNSPYAAAKWAASDYARMFHALYRFPVAIARVFMVYGPRQQDETKLVPYVIRCLLQGKAPQITSGTHRIDWIFVDDVVTGFVRMAIAPDIDGKSIDLGSGTLITIRELVDRICALMKTDLIPAYGAVPDRPMEPLRIANVEESRRVLGWSPAVGLDEGLHRTIEWYRGQQ